MLAKGLWLRNAVDRLIWLPGQCPGPLAAYGIATLCIAVPFVLLLVFGWFNYRLSIFSTLYPAIMFASIWGGVRAGLFAALLGGLLSWGALWGEQFTFIPAQAIGGKIDVFIYTLVSVAIVIVADRCRRQTKDSETEEELRKLMVRELAHRLRNKIASVQAIISYQLRDHQEMLTRIIRQLAALSHTDALIETAQGRGAYIRDIAVAELAPYDESRLLIEGPAIFVPPKSALALGLMFHELATNSAKYGALLHASGRLSLTWSSIDTALSITWCESGGPPVSRPRATGCGSRLLTQASKMIGGAVQMDFASTGLVCRLFLPLSNISTVRAAALDEARRRGA